MGKRSKNRVKHRPLWHSAQVCSEAVIVRGSNEWSFSEKVDLEAVADSPGGSGGCEIAIAIPECQANHIPCYGSLY